MSWFTNLLRKALGIGARKAVEAGVDALQKHADSPAPRKVKLPPPISDREWQGLDDDHPTRPDLEPPPRNQRRHK